MSDNLRRYRAIRQALKQGYPGEPSGRLAQHLTSLAAFISGIIGSKSSQLPSIATKVPDRAKPDSRVKRLSRLVAYPTKTRAITLGLDHGIGHLAEIKT